MRSTIQIRCKKFLIKFADILRMHRRRLEALRTSQSSQTVLKARLDIFMVIIQTATFLEHDSLNE